MIKLIICDLDNTIWDGIWKEDKEEVKLKEKIIELIEYLDKKGILLSLCSKNDHSEELENFLEKKGLLNYFIYNKINWLPKSQNIFNIKEIFNISRWEDILFIDDELFELEEVKYSFPEIQILNVNDYLTLFENKEIQNREIIISDTNRKKVYQDNIKRQELAKAYSTNYQEFLKTLNMEATIRKANSNDIDRIFQLLYRTNQWNSSIKSLTKEEITNNINNIKVLELKDKIGDYGLIGVKIEKYDLIQQKIIIDSMTLSCRIAGRGLGSIFIIETINRQPIDKKIVVQFKETKYNNKLHELYTFLNFKIVKQEEDIFTYEHNKTLKLEYAPWIKVYDDYLDISLREANDEDYTILCKLAKEDKYIKAFPGMSYRWGWKGKIMLAIADNKIVGFHYYNICKNKPWSNSYFIYSSPEFRNRGIASILFHDFIKLSEKRNKQYIKWLVSPKNEISFNYYKNNNVSPIGKRKGYYEYQVTLPTFKSLI